MPNSLLRCSSEGRFAQQKARSSESPYWTQPSKAYLRLTLSISEATNRRIGMDSLLRHGGIRLLCIGFASTMAITPPLHILVIFFNIDPLRSPLFQERRVSGYLRFRAGDAKPLTFQIGEPEQPTAQSMAQYSVRDSGVDQL
jgi:hypothetical protein